MTEIEKAEEYANKNVPTGTFGYRSLGDVYYDVKQAYLAGLKSGKPKWHKVADGDLPKHTRYVWTNVGPSYYDDDRDSPCWRDEFGRTQGVIAWCEPKFKE